MHRTSFLSAGALAAGLAFSAPAWSQSTPHSQDTSPPTPLHPAAQPGAPQGQGEARQRKPAPGDTPGQGGSGQGGAQAQGGAQQADPGLMKQARQALADIGQAQAAIAAKDDAKARQHLTRARATLDRLYGSGPGAKLVKQMDKTQGEVQQRSSGVDFAPLMATLRETETYMDPAVVAGVKQAQQQYEKGDAKQSAETLRLSRHTLVADVAALPVEATYARVVAAQALLKDGQREDALRLLRGVPVTVTEVSLATPMVPVRFNLRAAARAAEEQNWKKAESLLGTAAQQLGQLERTADAKAAKALEPLADEAERLKTQVASGQKPKAEQLRKLAQRTDELDAG